MEKEIHLLVCQISHASVEDKKIHMDYEIALEIPADEASIIFQHVKRVAAGERLAEVKKSCETCKYGERTMDYDDCNCDYDTFDKWEPKDV